MSAMRGSAALLVGVIVAASGCGGFSAGEDPLAARIGRACSVQFRRGDGLGAGDGNPVPPTTSNINGADVSVNGKLMAVGGGWVTVVAGKVEYCIPRESILLIEFRP